MLSTFRRISSTGNSTSSATNLLSPTLKHRRCSSRSTRHRPNSKHGCLPHPADPSTEYRLQECKEEKLNYGEVEAVLHVFDGSSYLAPGAMNNALFSNVFPANARLLGGSLDGFPKNNTLTDLFGSLLDWDLGVFDLRSRKPWDLLDLGSGKALRGARADLTGLFTKKLPYVPKFLKKGSLLS